jgi:hypothetical protein
MEKGVRYQVTHGRECLTQVKKTKRRKHVIEPPDTEGPEAGVGVFQD